MFYVCYGLIAIYAFLMGGAAILQRSRLGMPLTAGNLVFSVCLLLAPLHPALLAAGLAGLLLSAIGNGFALHSKPHLAHLLVRIAVSLVLCTGFWVFWR